MFSWLAPEHADRSKKKPSPPQQLEMLSPYADFVLHTWDGMSMWIALLMTPFVSSPIVIATADPPDSESDGTDDDDLVADAV